jgi:hypothetical protein
MLDAGVKLVGVDIARILDGEDAVECWFSHQGLLSYGSDS